MSSASQEKLIRVLHVDDDTDHLLVSTRSLEKCDSAIQVVSISSPEEALQKAESFDCVVSDYQMPGMNGIELARRIREKTDIPIIIYTGKGSEEVASSAFEAGVDDYLRKEFGLSHYQVLAKHIRTTVQRRRAEEAERKRVKELNCLYGISRLVESGLDLEGILGSVTTLIPQAGSYPEETCAKITLEGLSYDTDNFRETSHVLSAGINVRGENVGSIMVCYLGERPEGLGSPFLEEEQHLLNAVAERLGRIIERKQFETELKVSEERWRSLVELAPVAILTVNMRGVITSANDTFLKYTGFPLDEVVGKNFSKLGSIRARDLPKYMKMFSDSLRGRTPLPLEHAYTTRDGETRWGVGHYRMINVGGKREILAIFMEVTDQRKLEAELRKYTEGREARGGERTHERWEAGQGGLSDVLQHVMGCRSRWLAVSSSVG